uniref:Uncharacterized protein LOC113792336 isoform X1 n=1 Tax=Dermatophagoides pteronyssinus TaxID=6956 RepID=A0A6P6Y175_DERPT|nr:uncharacterized protein LOC113792336 isoform X1 [Dermatophagoides pteronyssinus]
MFTKIFLSDLGFINLILKSSPYRTSKFGCPHLRHRRPLSNHAENSIIQTDEAYDIVINGGGIVGFSMFAAIKSSPFLSAKRVLLIEQQSQPQPSSSAMQENRKFSNRVSAITLSSKQFFEQLKIWNSLLPYAKPVHAMYVWSNHYQNGINFGHDSPYEDEMCYILENTRMLQALHDQIESNSNPLQKISYKTSVVDINQDVDVRDSQATTIKLKIVDLEDTEQQQKSIQTRLLIGCDGYKSIVRSKSTLPYFEADLDQMGIVGTLEVETLNKDNSIAFQRFVSDQLVIALLPLDECHSSLVLSVPKQSVQDWMKLSDQEFVSRLNNEIIREPKIQNPLDKLASTFNVRQLFLEFQIDPPTEGNCLGDKFTATASGMTPTAIPVLCGNNRNQHIYLSLPTNQEKRSVSIVFETNALGDYRFHLKITQIDCRVRQPPAQTGPFSSISTLAARQSRTIYQKIPNQLTYPAPTGCLQYFTQPTGTIESFNFGHYLNNLDYAICIERQPDTCRVIYSATDLNFGIESSQTGTMPAAGDRYCSNDYLLLIGGSQTGEGTTLDRYCGGKLAYSSLETTETPVITKANGPIVVRFHSDATHSVTLKEGFRVKYEQSPTECSTATSASNNPLLNNPNSPNPFISPVVVALMESNRPKPVKLPPFYHSNLDQSETNDVASTRKQQSLESKVETASLEIKSRSNGKQLVL